MGLDKIKGCAEDAITAHITSELYVVTGIVELKTVWIGLKAHADAPDPSHQISRRMSDILLGRGEYMNRCGTVPGVWT